MPTVLLSLGWRLHFYSNDRNEPIHIHAVKGDAECKYWLYPDEFRVEPAMEYNLTPRLRREVRRIIYDHFDELARAWEARFQRHHAD